MTSKDKKAYWRKYARENARYERSGVVTFKKAILRMVEPVSVYASKSGAQMALAHIDVLMDRKVIEDAFVEFYLHVGEAHKRWTDADIRSRMPKQKDRMMPPPPRGLIAVSPADASFGAGFFNAKWLQKLKRLVYSLESAKRVTSIANNLKKKLRAVLGRAVKEEVRPSAIAARIQNEIGGKFSEARAKLIARTETTYLANTAARESAMESGLELEKYWINTQDARVRDSHNHIDQLIGFDEKFKIGDALMDRPGDPAGGAAECCNCRCTVAYIPKLEEQDYRQATRSINR